MTDDDNTTLQLFLEFPVGATAGIHAIESKITDPAALLSLVQERTQLVLVAATRDGREGYTDPQGHFYLHRTADGPDAMAVIIHELDIIPNSNRTLN